jgi:hypothetical protein
VREATTVSIRKNDRLRWSLRLVLVLTVLAAVTVSCGGSRDDRDEVRASNGEPDDIQYTEGPFSDIEEWFYFDFEGTGKTRYYRFERSRNSCGGKDNYVLTLSGDMIPQSSGVVEEEAGGTGTVPLPTGSPPQGG